MGIRRLSGPAAIVSPSDLSGELHGDAAAASVIAAVQASIDGPTGWLGRSLGLQELELTTDGFCRTLRLPYEPVTKIVSVSYRDRDGIEQSVDAAHWRLAMGNRCVFGTGFSFPATERAPDAVTVVYEAGYADSAVPASAKQAVIIGVQHLKALTEQSVFVRSEEVDGIGTETFAVSEAGANVVKAATDALLMPLRVYSL